MRGARVHGSKACGCGVWHDMHGAGAFACLSRFGDPYNKDYSIWGSILESCLNGACRILGSVCIEW